MRIWGDIPKVSGVYSTGKIDRLSMVNEVSSKQDELTISGTAKDFNVAIKALRQISDIRQSRVDEISQKMECGEYSVSASDIADKIIGMLNQKKD